MGSNKYTDEYRRETAGYIISTGRPINIVAESFFATLKNEMYYRQSFATRSCAKHAVIEFIESYYNRRRPHSSIGYKIPAEVMEAFFERTKPKQEESQVSLGNVA